MVLLGGGHRWIGTGCLAFDQFALGRRGPVALKSTLASVWSKTSSGNISQPLPAQMARIKKAVLADVCIFQEITQILCPVTQGFLIPVPNGTSAMVTYTLSKTLLTKGGG